MAQRREVGSPGHGGGLSPGAHVLLVRARDEYGRELPVPSSRSRLPRR